jgi:hypothetical protein|tara:strand:- start:971 stop:1372 length:402 start_codon:yes stop_codon:yes gene_type:complete
MKPMHALALLVPLILLSLPGLSYGQDFELAGQWNGSWKSCNSGHHGKLNAQFCRLDETHVQAKFTGSFAKVIPFRYRPVLNIVHEESGLMILEGNKKLPLVGNFYYTATVSEAGFSATYRSRRDQGVWQMSRH